MFRWQTLLGVVIGLFSGFALLALSGGVQRRSTPSGPILSECHGRMRELVIQYEPSAKDMVGPTYREFLGTLGEDVTVHILCPDKTAFDEVVALVGPVRCRILPILAGHAMTTWSRDRWVAFEPASPPGPTTLWSPRGEAGDEIWPARAGDERVGPDIAAALTPSVLARRSNLYFDGGDFLVDDENVFVTARVVPRNLQHTVASREELLGILTREFKRHVVLLDESPDHHAGMFMASPGGKVMLVGDPSLGRQSSSNLPDELALLPGGPDFTPQTQHLFDAVAGQCSALGYRVIRIPLVPAQDGRTWLTYLNVLMDHQRDRLVVYVPSYHGFEPLNAAARAVWESIGCEVRPVDCTRTFRHFGGLHCLVNVLKRS